MYIKIYPEDIVLSTQRKSSYFLHSHYMKYIHKQEEKRF